MNWFLTPRRTHAASVLALATACGANLVRDGAPPSGPQDERRAAAELAPFRESFDESALSPRWKFELADESRKEIVASPARRGRGSLKITLHPDDRVAKKNRAEIKLFNREPAGSEGWYAWSFLIPEEYAEAPREDLFQIMGQWHDQPPDGTAWKDYEAHPPLLAVKYGVRGEKRGLEITYGLVGRNKGAIARTEIEKGRWIDLLFHVHWSQGDDGFVEVWKDGTAISHGPGDSNRVVGPNMYNASPPYLKLGLYRQDGFDTVNSVYFDEVRIGRTRAEVEAP